MTAVVVAGILTQEILGVIEQPSITVAVLSQGLTINNIISDSGTGNTTVKLASEAVGGHRVVISDGAQGVIYADKDETSGIVAVLGVTNGAANIGDPVTITLNGEISDVSWTWTPNDLVYLGNNGLLTQTPPDSGFMQIIGTAIAPTVLNVKIGVPIQLI